MWKQATEFPENGDWIFASPLKHGKLPYSYTGFWRELGRAGKASGIGHIGTHTFRHSYRMWIDAVGTPIGVQQKLMRHADIRTTLNIYCGFLLKASISEIQIIRGAWTPSFYGYDGHGSVRQLTNAAGAVTDSYDYDAFGNLTSVTGDRPVTKPPREQSQCAIRQCRIDERIRQSVLVI